ncbi:MAG: hypothetical protein M1833_006959 [Piccolia ochrophora]|nr:MAG: hypothetical protein M1833_006959 [Piccolia ochrophora]
MNSILDLVNDCDNFPYPPTPSPPSPPTYRLTHQTSTLSHLLPPITTALLSLPPALQHETLTHHPAIHILSINGATPAQRTAHVAAITTHWRRTRAFAVLAGWRDELYPVYAAGGAEVFRVERAASPLFGVVTYGVHMTVYTLGDPSPSPSTPSPPTTHAADMKIWVPRRSATKQTYPSLLDNSVAGGISAGETPLASLVREAGEEAGLAERVVLDGARPCGVVSYFHVRDGRAGGEVGLLQPECQFVYDLELPEGEGDVQLRPVDNEAESFALLPVAEVVQALRRGEFKPNCAMVMIDFLVRHGVVNAENEPEYLEVVARLRRRLEFPLWKGGVDR